MSRRRIMSRNKLLSKEEEREFRAVYPHKSNLDIASMFRLSVEQVDRLGARYRLKKTDRSRALREVYKSERLRVERGLPQLTKLRITSRPRRLYCAGAQLLNKNYMVDYDYRIAYYDEQTQRGKWEKTYADVFEFQEWTEEVSKLYEPHTDG